MPAAETTASDALIELVAEAADGDRSAQEHLLQRYWPLIRQAVRGRKNRLGNALAAREETQDLEQDAALKVLAELKKHEWRGRQSFAAWIRRLAQVEVIDAYRHHTAKKRDAGAEEAPALEGHADARARSFESKFDDDHKMQELMKRIEELKAEYGAALMMHHMGFSHAEIGETLDCTTEAARKLVSRGRIRLMESMDEDSES